jgi:hypothetical protein
MKNKRRIYLFLGFLLSLSSLFSFQNCSEVQLEPQPIPAKSISLKVESYCPSPGFSFSEIYSVNLSTFLDHDNVIPDSDRDGLSDKYEKNVIHREAYNISEVSDDTNGNGYSDLVMATLGFDEDTQNTLTFCNIPYQDSDRDLLDDCAEELIGTEVNNPDSDKDGIPDGLEFRHGLNPRDGEDAKTDLDQDNLNALLEVKINTPIRNTNSQKASMQSTKYIVNHYIDGKDRDCYSIDINNISVADVYNGNYIKLLVLETAFIPEQGEVSKIRDVSIIVSKTIIDSAHITISEVNNQTETFGFD